MRRANTMSNAEILAELAERSKQPIERLSVRIWGIFVKPMIEDGETCLDGEKTLSEIYADHTISAVAEMMEKAGIETTGRNNDLIMAIRI